MKSVITLVILLVSQFIFSFSFAAVDSKQSPQEYKFKFNFKGASYEFKQTSTSFEVAYELAAKACYKHYKAGQKLDENTGLDIIDVCANPRS